MTSSPRTTLRTPPRRLHPLTPFAKLWPVVVFLGIVLAQNAGSGGDAVRGGGAPFFAGGAVVVLGGALGVGYVIWSRTTFWFDDDGDFRYESRLLQVRERRVQLSRLQAVDVVRPLAARVLGLAELRIDVAGGRDSKVRLAYLSQDDAAALRAEMLARSAGVEHDVGEGPAPEAPEATLVEVPTARLIQSVLLGPPTVAAVVALVVVIGLTIGLRSPGILLTSFFAVAGLVIAASSEFTRYFGFVLAESPDGLRTRSGLIETRAQTVPPGRVQAVGLSQPLLWRRFGWVRVQVDVAGRSGEADAASAAVLLPVVPEPVALALLARVLPGFDPTAVALDPAPERARWRAPLQASRYAAGLGEAAVVSRYGRLTRRTVVVPYARVQSVRIVRGPWQRRLRLTTLHVDTPGGPVDVVAPQRDEHQARDWLEQIASRALQARAEDTSEHWMRPRPTPDRPSRLNRRS